MSFYLVPDKVDEIQQGDIFPLLPFFRMSSERIVEVIRRGEEAEYLQRTLSEISQETDKPKKVISDVIFKPAIIITQNCDLLRSPYVSYCEVVDFDLIDENFSNIKNQGKKVKALTQKRREDAKHYYLPEEPLIGFGAKKGVDFSSVHQIKLELLNDIRHKRSAKLNDIALEHFRQMLANYYIRYAYDEWYPLTKAEFQIYRDDLNGGDQSIKPMNWQ